MPTALSGELRRLARRGWRLDVANGDMARVSRPVLWLPVWAHLLLLPVTCGAWGVVWALVRRPDVRRTARHVWVTGDGRVVSDWVRS